jgi:hypothetical protein
MIEHDMCDCGADSVRTTLSDGWQKMSEKWVNYWAVVRCVGCEKVLKPPGTVRIYDDKHGKLWATQPILKVHK